MKKFSILFFVFHFSFFILHSVSAQWGCSCLPEGITFNTQAQIDSFQVNYPGCKGIEGDVTIYGPNITNLNGLNVLTSIGGGLSVESAFALTSLTGLDNLNSIGGNLYMHLNLALTSLTGLASLTSIGGNFIIAQNDILTDFTGLNNLASIGGNFSVGYYYSSPGGSSGYYGNPSLVNFNGLTSLASVSGSILVYDNDSLTSFTGLENLDTIQGDLIIGNRPCPDSSYVSNPSLVSITGLNNVNFLGGNLTIIYNESLTDCEINAICNYISNPTGIVEIHHNATGCNNPVELADGCGVLLPCLPYGNYYFFSQSDIDLFQAAFPNCMALQGDVIIWGNDITDLSGLDAVTSIGGDLQIGDYYCRNPVLTSLNGLESLTSIGGSLNIKFNEALNDLTGLESLSSIQGTLFIAANDSLTSLNGLENLASIGASFFIGKNLTGGNPVLNDIAALVQLTSVGGSITIQYNDSLTSLNGLDNLSSIGGDLRISGNDALIDIFALNNLTTIGLLLIENNDALVSLSGLENLQSVERLSVYGNSSLTSITALQNVNSVGSLHISSNFALASLAGLDGLTSIGGDLTICENPLLSYCEIEAICAYLTDPNGDIQISNNAPGCDSEEEVEAACLVGVGQLDNWTVGQLAVRVYPNPVTDKLTLDCSGIGKGIEQVEIYNVFGARVGEYRVNGKDPMMTFDMTGLPAGLYFCKIQLGQQVVTRKIVKV